MANLLAKLIASQSQPNLRENSHILSSSYLPQKRSEIVPPFDSGIFHLKPYSKLKHTQEIVYSDTLLSNGLQWRLKIYPNGNGAAKGVYLSVFLEMIKVLLPLCSRASQLIIFLNREFRNLRSTSIKLR